METNWSWVQPLHSTVASSELRDMYAVYNREVSKIGFRTQDIMPSSVTTYQQGKLITIKEKKEKERKIDILMSTKAKIGT